MTLPLLLASTSPRRFEILKLLKMAFKVVTPLYEEENLEGLSPYEEVQRFALEKAKSIAAQYPKHLILGSDTLIEFRGEKIGKPKDASHAEKILEKLQGASHDILTSTVVWNSSEASYKSQVDIVNIKMKKASLQEIKEYIKTGEPLDKAGAYGLQGLGCRFIESLSGDYLAAVGLSLRSTAKLLQEYKFPIAVDVEKIYREKNFMNWKNY